MLLLLLIGAVVVAVVVERGMLLIGILLIGDVDSDIVDRGCCC